jgi:hypothetical protein
MWEQLGGSMSFVSTAEERILWGLDSDGDVWVLNTGAVSIEEI